MPDDVRLAGFDGEEAALLAGITTLMFDWQTLATTAMEIMFQLISAPDDKKIIAVQHINTGLSSQRADNVKRKGMAGRFKNQIKTEREKYAGGSIA